MIPICFKKYEKNNKYLDIKKIYMIYIIYIYIYITADSTVSAFWASFVY